MFVDSIVSDGGSRLHVYSEPPSSLWKACKLHTTIYGLVGANFIWPSSHMLRAIRTNAALCHIFMRGKSFGIRCHM